MAFAAQNAEEAYLIADILHSFSSQQAYAQYADWLDTREVDTAEYIRQLGAGTAPDATPSRSESWLRFFGVDHPWWKLRSAATREFAGAIEEWVRPTIRLTATSTPDSELLPGCSKFRGSPDLPASLEWPTCEFGPLHFQAQINLRELRISQATLRYGIPTSGWLLLFAFDDPEEGTQPGVVRRDVEGNWEEIPNLARLVYLSDGTQLERRPPPAGACDPRGSCRLSLGEDLDLPWADDTADVHLQENEGQVGQFRAESDWESKMFGYPVHGRTSNTSPGPDWLNVFTLGSVRDAGWSWCDGQHLDVYVHADGVRSGTFEPFYAYAA